MIKAPCPCTSASARFDQFRLWRSLDWDTTEGRYADVDVQQCLNCDRLWLSYAVEYEAFSKSGRWARGVILEESAKAILPQEAVAFLAALPSHLYGGSWFNGESGERTGPMNWGI